MEFCLDAATICIIGSRTLHRDDNRGLCQKAQLSLRAGCEIAGESLADDHNRESPSSYHSSPFTAYRASASANFAVQESV